MNKGKTIKKSGEDYLETILQIEQSNDIVRSIDIANKLKVSRASVNKAMVNLSKLGMVKKELYGDVILTERGRELAEKIQKRHNVLKNFLTQVLGVGEATAEVDACKMEHATSDETITKLIEFIDNIKNQYSR